jgi:hypothetical protein
MSFAGTWLILKWFHGASYNSIRNSGYMTALHFDLYFLAVSLLACKLITCVGIYVLTEVTSAFCVEIDM